MEIAKFIDHTNIKKDASPEEIKKSCEECKEFGFRGLCVRPEYTKLAKENLKDTQTKVITLIDPPMGISSLEEKLALAKKAKEDGSDEIDVVMNVVDFKHGRYEKIIDELKEICKILPTKVIIGAGYLTKDEIKKATEIVKESGAICVKTATEKDPTFSIEERAFQVKIMKENAGNLLVKAAGGIRNLSQAILMIEMGADIIGTSSGVEIVKEALSLKER